MLSNSDQTNKKGTILCVYVGFNIDEDDIRFISANSRDCTFVVIESMNARSLYNTRLRDMPTITYKTRPNIGYDVTAWKEYILEDYDRIKTFDYLVLVNNSCRYDFSIKNAVNDMQKKGATFYGLNISPVHNNHVQSYFTIIDRSIVKSPGFLNHWLFMPEIIDRDAAIQSHELTFMNDMVNSGAKVATLTDYDFIGSTYEIERYNESMGVVPPFLKKRLLSEGANKTKYERLLRTLPHML